MITEQIAHPDPLTIEFESLCADDEGLLRRWRRDEPALAGYVGLGDIYRALAPHAPTNTKDAVLLALIRRAQLGDARPATICILTALRPKVLSMAARVQPDSAAIIGLSRRDIACALQSAMYEAILGYRAERWTRKVAATLALNALHSITDRRDATATACPDTTVDLDTWRAAPVRTLSAWVSEPTAKRPLHIDWAHPARGVPVTDLHGHSPASAGAEQNLSDGHPPTRETEATQMLAWAVRVGAISRHDAKLLHDLYLGTLPYASAVREAARVTGRTPAAIRQRCSRATRAIANAVRQSDPMLDYQPAA